MLNRLYAAFAALFVLTASAQGAGTVPGISMTQQLDALAKPLSGGKLYFIVAGTTATPQNCYQDTALTLVWPNPITLDAAGRVPQIFCADGTIKIRLTDKNGVQQLVQDNLLVVGPSSGGGGGGTVDPTTIFQTGAFMQMYGTSVLSGWVRANGRTIGSATSGATERANSDTSALFVYLWSTDASLAVSGGRGASAAADFAANKTIALPDIRGRVMAGFDDMGAAAAGRLTTTTMSGTGIGATGGSQTATLTLGQLPTGITANGANSISVLSQYRLIGNTTGAFSGSSAAGGTQLTAGDPGNGAVIQTMTSTGSNSVSVTSNNTGGQAHNIIQPTIFVTTYIKL